MKIDLSFKKTEKEIDRASIDGDILTIDCKGCGQNPDMGSPICIRCVTRSIVVHGNPERISLITGRNREYSGNVVEFLNEMAAIDRMASAIGTYSDSKCKGCENSCSYIFGIAWSTFPDPDFSNARAKLRMFEPTRPECNGCIQKTYRMLDQAELSFDKVSKKASKSAYSLLEA